MDLLDKMKQPEPYTINVTVPQEAMGRQFHVIITPQHSIAIERVPASEPAAGKGQATGRKRKEAKTESGGMRLTALGIPRAYEVAAGLACIKGMLSEARRIKGVRMTPDETEAAWHHTPDIGRSARKSDQVRGFMYGGIGTALHWVLAQRSQDLADRLFSDLCTAELPPENPIRKLREAIIELHKKAEAEDHRVSNDEVACLTFRAWNQLRKRKYDNKPLQGWSPDKDGVFRLPQIY